MFIIAVFVSVHMFPVFVMQVDVSSPCTNHFSGLMDRNDRFVSGNDPPTLVPIRTVRRMLPSVALPYANLIPSVARYSLRLAFGGGALMSDV